MMFSKKALDIDASHEAARISDFIHEMTFKRFKRKGAVIGLSGGIDSAVAGELCVRALGKEKVIGLLLPEKESNPVSLEFGQKQAKKMGIDVIKVDITSYLEALQVYDNRNSVIKSIFPGFDDSHQFHVTLPQNLLEKDRVNYHTLTIEDKEGKRESRRLSGKEWMEISACQNMKQRVRMIQLYYHAEKNNYLVAGTTNKTEARQGFFVKFGDGGVDIEPIAHLYKTQVYQLANDLGVIREIIERPPSPDTYSLPVTDKEFYFCIDYELLDLLLFAYENNVPGGDISKSLNLEEGQIDRVFKDFKAKEQATWHLRTTAPMIHPPVAQTGKGNPLPV